MEFNQNNISTIVSMIFPFIAALAAKYFGVTLDAATTIAGISAVIELILLLWSAKNPNTIAALGNSPKPVSVDTEETVLNDEYEVDSDESC
jgi:uncharacterized membrane protein